MVDQIVPEIQWKVKQNYLYKNDLMLLDLIASNNWERPIYFASPSAVENVLDVAQYCHLEGIVYRFLPVKANHYMDGLGGINPEESYDLLVNKAKWGNLNKPGVYIDPESRRNSVMPKQDYFRLAQALIDLNRNDSAVKVLDKCQESFPNSKICYDIYTMPMVEAYYDAGAPAKAVEASEILFNNFVADLDYYGSQTEYFKKYYQQEIERAFAVLQQLAMLAKRNKQTEHASKIEAEMNMLLDKF
jgi:tetratricopeptide (TPR) repeat protein